ncbi:MAG: hypothetical protein CEN89_180 [Candidatus Berkelbacteria bacterium Licking1014_7]|uniref:NYN domain-containing protein n=1 Tax=Candidatus Berkelbacteria bacterium Licking1014_7 TaxID=2017147 RepID=A0A554LJX7_9BACT|nr:MAG: hypothetical protein CEN89_180 [Candidatus Berkelbacteria bacterium Licking1014_7]
MSKTILFVDGSNLYGGFTEILKPGEYFDFSSFLKIMEKDFKIDQVNFYGTYMRIDKRKSKEIHKLSVMAQKAFFDSAKRNPKVKFTKGHFSGFGKEKAVDVKLAVDIAVGAARNEYKEAIIMTGDADFIYAVRTAKNEGKPVHLAAFCTRFPYGMFFSADQKIVYDFGRYFKKHILPNLKFKPKNLIIKEISPKIKIKVIK